MTPWTLALSGWLGAAILMLAAYGLARAKKDAGIVDVTWAASVGLLGIYFAVFAGGEVHRRVLIAALVAIWSFRLAGYLLVDRFLRGPEDGRYQMLRSRFAGRANVFFFGFFQLQAFWAVLFAVPLLPGLFLAKPFPAWSDAAGVAVWLVAVIGEGVADRQLARFRREPGHRGKTCRAGLWRYSRHPNYFFEWVHWFTYVILAIGSVYVWVSLLGPVVMLVFLYKITGIPYTEKRALLSRGEDYRRYQRTTSAFIPWPPRAEP